MLPNGHSSVQVDNKTYSIDTPEKDHQLLENGRPYYNRIMGKNRSMPFVKKLFAMQMPGMKAPMLVVWFYKKESHVLGHDAGLYVYVPEALLNTWDKYQIFSGTVDSDTDIQDVTVFQGQMFILAQNILFYSLADVFSNVGSFGRVDLFKISGIRFSIENDRLFFYGYQQHFMEPIYNKYLYRGVKSIPKIVATIEDIQAILPDYHPPKFKHTF